MNRNNPRVRRSANSERSEPSRLLSAEQVADLIGGVTPAWVRKNVPHKLSLGYNTKRWYRHDVEEWIGNNRRPDPRSCETDIVGI